MFITITLQLDFWEEPRGLGSRVMFMVSPTEMEGVRNALTDARMPIDVEHDNVQRWVLCHGNCLLSNY